MSIESRPPIRQRILRKSSISCVIKLGYADDKRWFASAHERLGEIVSSGHLIVWPLGDAEQSQGELDLLLEQFEKTKKPCSVVQLNWHLLADPTQYANGEAAKRYQLLDSLLRRSQATLERLWLSCYEKSASKSDGLCHLEPVYFRHCKLFTFDDSRNFGTATPAAPLRSTYSVRALMLTLAHLLNCDGQLTNLRDLVVQWPILAYHHDFTRPTLGGVLAAAPELRNLYVDSCSKLIEEEIDQRAAVHMRRFDDFIVRKPMTARSLQRLTIGENLADCVDSDRFFYSLVELTAPKLRRIEFFGRDVEEYNREGGRYRLLASVNTARRWFGAGSTRRRMTPGSERPTGQLTCAIYVDVEEKDGAVVMTVKGEEERNPWTKKAVLDELALVNRECVTRPRQLRLGLRAVANLDPNYDASWCMSAAAPNAALMVPFHTNDFAGFDLFSLDIVLGIHEHVQRAVASLDSAWRERFWEMSTNVGDWQRIDECWHSVCRLLDVLPGVRRVDLGVPQPRGRRCRREWSVRIAAFIDRIERDGTWKFKRFSPVGDDYDAPYNRAPFYERSPRGIERAYARHHQLVFNTLVFVRAGVTRRRWLLERGLVKA